ncbi:hypothetical protein ABEG17_01295 [Pedococcus sp. KACC 23699]|uniref:Uncharacterized protein n=1 Tax=Pedococcus sp. KACC 23699 TaxID=3149228 RepID=A0AAU7JVA4_9MICO
MRRRLAALDTAHQLGLALAMAVLVGAVTVAVPVLNSTGLLVACAGLVAAMAVLGQWLWQSRGSTDWTHTFRPPPRQRGADLRIARLADDIRSASGGDLTAAGRLHETLTSLAADQLRLRRGISLTQDPERAHAALGPDLTSYLTLPAPSRLSGDRLEAFTTTLEEL